MPANSPTANPPEAEKGARRWLAATIGVLALLIVANLLVAWRMDVFGIFRDPKGRELVTSEHERKAKFLLNRAYVPDNFDALVIGASSQMNWRLEYFNGYRYYNESLEGGDATEERKLVEQALPRGHFKVAVIGLYPRVTALHVLQDGFDQVRPTEALGSISSLGTEFEILKNRILHKPEKFHPNGCHELPVHAPPTPEHSRTPMNITQDSVAVADYQALSRELLASGTRVVYVVDPLYEPQFENNTQEMAWYMKTMHETLPAAPYIDLNAPEYFAFRNDAGNFIDDVHLSAAGTETLSKILNTRLQQVLETTETSPRIEASVRAISLHSR
jgi:hypothetical protein